MTDSKTDSIVLGGGCFWCLEAAYQMVRGVTKVVSGYAGGDTPGPSYQTVCSGRTGHAEVVRVEFDTTELSLLDVLEIFWTIHDPTTLNQQGNDVGTEYRSVILYHDAAQRTIINQAMAAAAKVWPSPIVTEVKSLEKFYPAEPEHQNFFKKHPEMGYCQIIINPKLEKLRQKFAERLVDL